jgi:hypothetical protein
MCADQIMLGQRSGSGRAAVGPRIAAASDADSVDTSDHSAWSTLLVQQIVEVSREVVLVEARRDEDPGIFAFDPEPSAVHEPAVVTTFDVEVVATVDAEPHTARLRAVRYRNRDYGRPRGVVTRT